MKKKYIILAVIICIAVLAATIIFGKKESTEQYSYESITTDEAKEVFASEGSYMILDVRTAEEFAEGHIPGAIQIANEEIQNTQPKQLPDKEQTIYVYCRSGRRSKEASGKLASMGYKNIIECGGIMDWTGEIEK